MREQMIKFNRAERIKQIKRLKKARKSFHGYELSWGTEGKKKMSAKALGKVVQYPCICSCFLCSNNKKYYGNSFNGLHVKEKSFLLLLKSEKKGGAV